MSVLKPRNRLVYFRISEDEFQQAAEICQVEGARSLSDFARLAMQRVIRDGSASPDHMLIERLKIIDELLTKLNQNLAQLTQLLAAHAGGSENGQNGRKDIGD